MDKITLDHVTYIYSQGTPFEKRALDDVSFGLKAGKITGVIGHTGSGKSTMAQLLNGIAKPTSGKILLNGKDIHASVEDEMNLLLKNEKFRDKSRFLLRKLAKRRIAKRQSELCFRVGLVMQYPEYQLFDETVESDIGFGPRNMNLTDEEIKTRVMEAAAFAGIGKEMLARSPFDLSGGEKRRVALAGVMAMRPEVLVLDEPAAGLDPRGKKEIFEGIVKYRNQTGATVVMISHSMEDMAKYCDEIVVLNDAKVAACGKTDEVFRQISHLNTTGLDLPDVTKLLKLLQDKGMPISADLYTVSDATAALTALFSGKAGA